MSRRLSIAIAVASIVFITFVFRMVAGIVPISIVNVTTVGFAYLIAVLLIAARWGITESVIASLAATVCFNYFFLPPVGTWTIEDPENWVALFAFLITSLIASELSNRARRRTAEMERLYALSRAMLAMDGCGPIGNQIAMELERICGIPAVELLDGATDAIYRAGTEHLPEVETRLREAGRSGLLSRDDTSGTTFAAIRLGDRNIGSIAIRGAEFSGAALQALLNLIAITLENARSRDIVTTAQAARQSEEFKSTLLDGLAHEFKTPLTSIKAAASALLASNVSDAAQRQELLTVVDQEAEHLSRLVTEATRVARIEAGKIQVHREWHPVDDVMRAVLAHMETQCDGRRVDVSMAPGIPAVFIDPDLIELALRQLIDNALKYSPHRSAIRVSIDVAGDGVSIVVSNEGEPLSSPERVRIFDKFYRGQNVRQKVAGTGMGLPVARDILLAHGGDVQLRKSDERGTEFVVTLPARI